MQEIICALCGEKIDEMDDDYEELADGRIVCISCCLSKCETCIGCFELFPKEDMIDLDVEGYCCKSCYDESMSVCEACGKPVSTYLLEYSFLDRKKLCPECYEPVKKTTKMPEYTLQDLLREYREKRNNTNQE